MMKITGLRELETKFDRLIKNKTAQITKLRKQVASDLIDAMVDNMPVWSGKTVRSLAVSNSEAGSNRREPHPQRGDYQEEGEWHYEEEYGPTSRMPLGSEPKRASSEAIAKATVDSTDYSLDKRVFITSDAYLWNRVNTATAPEQGTARNKPVVSALAMTQVKAKYGRVLK